MSSPRFSQAWTQQSFQSFPTRFTLYLRRAVSCAIASVDPNDDWRWHMYDTVKGSDLWWSRFHWICQEGPATVFELENMGLPFSRTEEGKIYKELLVVNQKIMEKVVKQKEPVLLQIEQARLFYILYIRQR